MSFEEFIVDPYQEATSNPFGTPEEKKDRNKAANMAVCNKRSYGLTNEGGLKEKVLTCKYYRECDNCRQLKYDNEVEPRLNYAQNHMILGDRPRFDRIMEDERGAYMKRLSRGDFDYYAFPQSNNEILVLHNDPNGPGDELWEFGYDDIDLYNEDNGLDINFYTILKDVPEGKKISGNLGKKMEDEPEGNGGQMPEEAETFSIKKPFLYKRDLTERDAHIYYEQALVKTLDIKVSDEDELERAMFMRINAMADLIGDDNLIVGFTWGSVTAEEIAAWNNNPNNFSKDVQISTYKNSISRNLDKNYKKSSFEAVIDRANRDDGLDKDRQQALDDFLRYHGT